MDSLNFFFGLKAVREPYVSDMSISETATGNVSLDETTLKGTSLRKQFLNEEKVTLINLVEQSGSDLIDSDRAIMDVLGEKSF